MVSALVLFHEQLLDKLQVGKVVSLSLESYFASVGIVSWEVHLLVVPTVGCALCTDDEEAGLDALQVLQASSAFRRAIQIPTLDIVDGLPWA